MVARVSLAPRWGAGRWWDHTSVWQPHPIHAAVPHTALQLHGAPGEARPGEGGGKTRGNSLWRETALCRGLPTPACPWVPPPSPAHDPVPAALTSGMAQHLFILEAGGLATSSRSPSHTPGPPTPWSRVPPGITSALSECAPSGLNPPHR